ncbi:hypothetical protein LJ739_03665 [Aestuariibacter halophilus]|uniref:Sel1 repeat family protein n=1 Tax=Fluctibacter halophilus TaxID=226011 RepID=A0ABS8G4H0_9ALTE|nr:hypothetical protein [Aestuariibacter halophilus]MCC2615333.1 hypothetical protein [Aestuariibacter halophilus]
MRVFRGALVLLPVIVCNADVSHDRAVVQRHFSDPFVASMWYPLAKQGDEGAQAALLEYAQQRNQAHWLKRMGALGQHSAYYHLAMQQKNLNEARRWLRKGAMAGDAESQYELALITDYGVRKVHWLEQAAQQNFIPAQVALYQWLQLQGDDEAAFAWLQRVAPLHGNSALLLGDQLWQRGDSAAAIDAFEKATALGNQQAVERLNVIRTYWQRPQDTRVYGASLANCTLRVQPVTASLQGMRRLLTLLQTVEQDARLSALPMCFNAPLWVEHKDLPCTNRWQGAGRLGCRLGPLAERFSASLDDHPFSHVMVMATQGKANVQDGVMYLDLSDSYDVFVHELAHFAGFVDEYPLGNALAQVHCKASLAPNVRVFQPVDQESGDDTVDVPEGWFKARTCNNHPAQAYKPSAKMTFMEFHDTAHIPQVYLELWAQRLSQRHFLQTAYQNLARASSTPALVNFWWQQEANYVRQPSWSLPAVEQAPSEQVAPAGR